MAAVPTKILVVDREKLVADLIKCNLEVDGEFEVSSSDSLAATVEILGSVAKNAFDIVLLETSLERPLKPADVGKLVQMASPARVVLFANHADKPFVDSCIQLGAFGFAPKSLSLEAFEFVLNFVNSGQVFIPAEVYTNEQAYRPHSDVYLKPSEMDVLEKLSIGMSNKEITQCLNLTESTVKLRVRTLCKKLGASNRTQVIVIAQQKGLIAPHHEVVQPDGRDDIAMSRTQLEENAQTTRSPIEMLEQQIK